MTASPNFNEEFQSASAVLLGKLEAAQTSPSVAPDVFRSFSLELVTLSKLLARATGALPSYDQRQAELQLRRLEAVLEKLRIASSISKPKFTFKKKEKALTVNAPPPPPLPFPVDLSDPTNQRATQPVASDPAISGRKSTYVDWDSLRSESSTVLTISHLDSCIVNLLRLPPPKSRDEHFQATAVTLSAAHVHDLSNTVLLLPPIEGSILLRNLCRCVVLVARCRQFRIHDSSKVDLYLSVQSHPIIERCSEIRFAGCRGITNADTESIAWPLSESGLDHGFDIQDFSHVRATPSPNWSRIPPDALIQSWPMNRSSEPQELEDELSRLLPPP